MVRRGLGFLVLRRVRLSGRRLGLVHDRVNTFKKMHWPLLAWTVVIGSQSLVGACAKSQTVVIANVARLVPGQPVTIQAPESLLILGSLNELRIQVDAPDSLSKDEWGIRRSDGVLIQVAAAMLRGDKTPDTMSAEGYSTSPGHRYLALRPSIADSLHPPFIGVRITASDSVTVSKIVWFSRSGW